jgi:hypothetical protein
MYCEGAYHTLHTQYTMHHIQYIIHRTYSTSIFDGCQNYENKSSGKEEAIVQEWNFSS